MIYISWTIDSLLCNKFYKKNCLEFFVYSIPYSSIVYMYTFNGILFVQFCDPPTCCCSVPINYKSLYTAESNT